jgi:hypothetical protein
MKDKQLCVAIEQLAAELEREINVTEDVERNCRLQDAKELLRRAFCIIEQLPFEENDLITRSSDHPI